MSRRRTRPNGYTNDVKAPDGFLLGGWRRVTKGGYLRFQSGRWTHPELASRPGDYAFVHVDDCWATTASFTFDESKIWQGPWNGKQWNGGRTPLEYVQ